MNLLSIKLKWTSQVCYWCFNPATRHCPVVKPLWRLTKITNLRSPKPVGELSKTMLSTERSLQCCFFCRCFTFNADAADWFWNPLKILRLKTPFIGGCQDGWATFQRWNMSDSAAAKLAAAQQLHMSYGGSSPVHQKYFSLLPVVLFIHLESSSSEFCFHTDYWCQ